MNNFISIKSDRIRKDDIVYYGYDFDKKKNKYYIYIEVDHCGCYFSSKLYYYYDSSKEVLDALCEIDIGL